MKAYLVRPLLRAQGHGVCDYNRFERAMNIISSIPYTMIGLHTLRRVVRSALCR